MLEGSVRKAGARVRITAQLIEAARDSHVWAERFDRNLDDIFALQDEISRAIVSALKLKLLPEEKVAIAQRGTASPGAYDLYLMARRSSISGNSDRPTLEATERLATRAIEIDPGYAQAWARLAVTQSTLLTRHGRVGEDGWAAAGRALALDDSLAEAHAVKARAAGALLRQRQPRRARPCGGGSRPRPAVRRPALQVHHRRDRGAPGPGHPGRRVGDARAKPLARADSRPIASARARREAQGAHLKPPRHRRPDAVSPPGGRARPSSGRAAPSCRACRPGSAAATRPAPRTWARRPAPCARAPAR